MITRATRTTYTCSSCGNTTPKWVGKCPRCDAWNSIEETAPAPPTAPGLRSNGATQLATLVQPVSLADIDSAAQARTVSGISELDRVLGGGLAAGSTVLLAGDPGIGKSTLLLQAAAGISQTSGTVIYATGEESDTQIKLRAERLGISHQRLMVASTGDVLSLGMLLDEHRPALLAIDSIQTAWHSGVDGAPGTIAQVRQATSELCAIARRTGVPVVIAGHVTKEGSIAGPKVLEHMVDVVLQMEGGTGTPLRLLRGTKNRYGATDELGVFEMTGSGLQPVDEPSARLLSERQPGASGSAIATVIEGTRPLTVEVQALVTPTQAMSPRRNATGYDPARLHLLVAVISKRLNIPLGSSDVVVNIAGGIRINEPAADLAVALAIVSSFLDIPVADGLSASAEIGLGGELRAVHQSGRRALEARRLGLEGCLLPARCGDLGDAERVVTRVATLADAVKAAIPMPTQGAG